jgi:hypothetical protein
MGNPIHSDISDSEQDNKMKIYKEQLIIIESNWRFPTQAI